MKLSIVEKSIDDAIWKCGQRLSIPKNVKNSFKVCRENTCNSSKPLKSEVGYLINDKGDIIKENKGNDSGVKFDDNELLELFNEYGELHFEHNHPLYEIKEIPVFLSPDDIGSLITSEKELGSKESYNDEVFPFKSITCEGANGTRMSMVRGDNFSNNDKVKLIKDNVIEKFAQDMINEFTSLESEIDVKYYNSYIDYAKNHMGESITDEMKKDLKNSVLKQVIKEGGINFDNVFRKYQTEFRKYNLKMTWEKNL